MLSYRKRRIKLFWKRRGKKSASTVEAQKPGAFPFPHTDVKAAADGIEMHYGSSLLLLEDELPPFSLYLGRFLSRPVGEPAHCSSRTECVCVCVWGTWARRGRRRGVSCAAVRVWSTRCCTSSEPAATPPTTTARCHTESHHGCCHPSLKHTLNEEGLICVCF